jgi:hypothetical protein
VVGGVCALLAFLEKIQNTGRRRRKGYAEDAEDAKNANAYLGSGMSDKYLFH